MKIELHGKAKILSVILLFAAVTGIGLLLDRIGNDRFVIETIPDGNANDETQNYAEKALSANTAADNNEAEISVADEKAEKAPESEGNPVVDGKVNINTAPAEVLVQLDGIGESTAKKIIEYRENNGSFSDVHELTLVNGIGEKKLEQLIDSICVE